MKIPFLYLSLQSRNLKGPLMAVMERVVPRGVCLTMAIFLLAVSFSFTQEISGRVTDQDTAEPLAYASIGIIGTNSGTITDESGRFSLKVGDYPLSAIVRISMVGYHAKTYDLSDLIGKDLTITLETAVTSLREITISPGQKKLKRSGTKTSSEKIITGWGGYGKGGERGTRIRIRKEPAEIEELHFHIASTTFDSLLFRVHIRDIQKGRPGKELLQEDILIPVAIRSGWVSVDMSPYRLVFDEDIALTLEWIRAWGDFSGEKSLHISAALGKGRLYAKEASEATWTVKKSISPGIYVVLSQ